MIKVIYGLTVHIIEIDVVDAVDNFSKTFNSVYKISCSVVFITFFLAVDEEEEYYP